METWQILSPSMSPQPPRPGIQVIRITGGPLCNAECPSSARTCRKFCIFHVEIAKRRLLPLYCEARLGSARSEVHLHSFQAASGEIDARYSIYDEPAGRQRDSETDMGCLPRREGGPRRTGCAIFSHSSSSARPGGQWTVAAGAEAQKRGKVKAEARQPLEEKWTRSGFSRHPSYPMGK